MKKLKAPRNLTTLAYTSVKRYILEGNLDENIRLTEGFVSRELGISKSPIREALNRLEAEGLIRIEPRRGAYLKRLTTKEAQDLYSLREELEAYVMRITRLGPREFTELERSIETVRTLLETGDKLGYIEEDVRFHMILANATGNAPLCQVLENVQNKLWLFRCKTYSLSSSVAVDFHQAIVDALKKNDRGLARKVMREHIQHVRNRLVEFLDLRAKSELPASLAPSARGSLKNGRERSTA